MQARCIMAFRKRLIVRGYYDVSIKLRSDGCYQVSARDPLVGVLLTRVVSLSEFDDLLR